MSGADAASPTAPPRRRRSRGFVWVRRILVSVVSIVALVAAIGAYGWFIDPGFLVRSLRSVATWKLGITGRTVTVQGHEWPYLEAGPRDGRPMLFLHGFGTSKDAMMQMAAAFGARGWRCIAPDLPGFGEHAYHAGALHDGAFYEHSLTGFMDAVQMPRATVVGTSMGGAIAADLAIRDPARVDALLLLSPAGVTPPVKNAFMERVASGKNPLDVASEADFDSVMNTVFLHPPKVPSPYRRWFVEQALLRRPNTLQIVEALRGFLTSGVEGRLGAITAPTLVMYGEQDAVTDPSMLRVYAAEMPAAHTKLLPDAGHVTFSDNWPATQAAMQEFLDWAERQRSTTGR